MFKNLIVALVAIAVTSCFWILRTKASSGEWVHRNYTCVVLKDDVLLKANWTNEVVGTLKKGVVLFVPVAEDYQATDPGDSSLHKVFLSLSADMKGHFYFVPQELSPTNQDVKTYNYLRAFPEK